MALKFSNKQPEEAELDVTSFMNLMIVLVPVMLLSLTFTQITVHEIKLPDLTPSATSANEDPPQLEVMVTSKGINIYYPGNVLIQEIPLKETDDGQVSYNFNRLSLVLQKMKDQLKEKRDVLILSEPSVDYQTLVSTMDAVKSYKTVLAASMVEIELFPEVSLADASIK